MFGTHNSIERWRRALTRLASFSQFAQPTFDSSIHARREQIDPYEMNPPFVEPERLVTPIHETRGEPEFQFLMESRSLISMQRLKFEGLRACLMPMADLSGPRFGS